MGTIKATVCKYYPISRPHLLQQQVFPDAFFEAITVDRAGEAAICPFKVLSRFRKRLPASRKNAQEYSMVARRQAIAVKRVNIVSTIWLCLFFDEVNIHKDFKRTIKCAK